MKDSLDCEYLLSVHVSFLSVSPSLLTCVFVCLLLCVCLIIVCCMNALCFVMYVFVCLFFLASPKWNIWYVCYVPFHSLSLSLSRIHPHCLYLFLFVRTMFVSSVLNSALYLDSMTNTHPVEVEVYKCFVLFLSICLSPF